MYFYPMEQHVLSPNDLGLKYEDVILTSQDGTQLHAWYLPAIVADETDSKGTIYYLHGNAENISTHILNIWWLPAQGYNVFILDYRGFGKSRGQPHIAGALEDIEAGHRWLTQTSQHHSVPVFMLGQSLGASLGIYYVASQKDNTDLLTFSGVISDAAFTRYADIVRHVAGKNWLTWSLQYPISWFAENGYDPIDYIDTLTPTPLLILHSQQDQIIPYEHGNLLFQQAKHPKQWLSTSGHHIATFRYEENRLALLHFLENASDR